MRKADIQKKCASRRGMTLMEILCALAVLGLLTAAIAFSIPAAVQTYHNATSGAEAALLCSTLSEAVAEELRSASDIEVGKDGSFIYNSQRFGSKQKLVLYVREEKSYLAAASADDPAQIHPLIAEKAYTSGLALSTESNGAAANRFVYLPEEKLFYVALTVTNAQTHGNAWNEFYVRPLNPPKVAAVENAGE